ncbi:MAG: DUF6338 family protein [Candidatus Electrothrix sp. Rat3]|nr:DUF6338 family protein [Candidatus Electrothrix rattekaaiensis]
MNIWDIDKLFLFIAFVIPGFISIKTYEILIPTESKDSSKQILDAIAYSCINYALLMWLILEVEQSTLNTTHPFLYKIFYTLVLFVFPIIWVLMWRWVRGWKFLQERLPHPTVKPWDYVFCQKQWYWIIVTLKNGDKIAGKYGGKSFTSSNPAPEQIYFEEAWVLNDDGGFDRPRRGTAGIIILSEEILTVELFEYNCNEE